VSAWTLTQSRLQKSVQDWAEIRRLHQSEGMPITAITRVMSVCHPNGSPSLV
jgi:hypothetical protein